LKHGVEVADVISVPKKIPAQTWKRRWCGQDTLSFIV